MVTQASAIISAIQVIFLLFRKEHVLKRIIPLLVNFVPLPRKVALVFSPEVQSCLRAGWAKMASGSKSEDYELESLVTDFMKESRTKLESEILRLRAELDAKNAEIETRKNEFIQLSQSVAETFELRKQVRASRIQLSSLGRVPYISAVQKFVESEKDLVRQVLKNDADVRSLSEAMQELLESKKQMLAEIRDSREKEVEYRETVKRQIEFMKVSFQDRISNLLGALQMSCFRRTMRFAVLTSSCVTFLDRYASLEREYFLLKDSVAGDSNGLEDRVNQLEMQVRSKDAELASVRAQLANERAESDAKLQRARIKV